MNSEPVLLCVNRLSPKAVLPRRMTTGSAGYDLFALESGIIVGGSRGFFHTGIAVSIPANHYGRIAARSSFAMRGLDIVGGVIDSDYRGEIIVILVNRESSDVSIAAGERIAQLILERISCPPVIESALDVTDRGVCGFGSTGH